MDLGRRKRKREAIRDIESWFHSIDLGDGVVTPGQKSAEQLEREVDALALPPLSGKTVLDIGAWDGYFSFEAERRGARRVVALDHYVWRIDSVRLGEYLLECKRSGLAPAPFDDVDDLWHTDGCPGRRGFDLARELLDSKVEPVVTDFMATDLAKFGTFDVVLYLGVLYHMRHPLLALQRLRAVTSELAVIESEAFIAPMFEGAPLCQFFERDELNDDWSNWWCPNAAALVAMCRAAGFRDAKVVSGPPRPLMEAANTSDLAHYRAVVHALP